MVSVVDIASHPLKIRKAVLVSVRIANHLAKIGCLRRYFIHWPSIYIKKDEEEKQE